MSKREKVAWHTADGTYRQNWEEVKKLLLKTFGPEHCTKYNPTSKRKQDNHGNWHLTFGGCIHFRYKRDLVWFALVAGHLSDISHDSGFFYCPYIPQYK